MIILFVVLFLILKNHNKDNIKAFTWSIIIEHICVLVAAYFLSIFEVLDTVSAWLFFLTITFLLILLFRKDICNQCKLRDFIKLDIYNYSITEKICVVIIVSIVIGMGIVAVLVIPYSYDSLTHYAPRILMWAQEKSVAHYASNINRQVASNNLASYVTLFIFVMYGKFERLLTIPQYLAYIVSAIYVYSITFYLYKRRIVAQIAVVLWMTTPIVFAEAITCQNDLYATIWSAIFVRQLVNIITKCNNKDNIDIFDISVLSSSIALGYLTKPSVCIGMVVMLVWYLITCINNRISIIKLIKQVLLAIVEIATLISVDVIKNIHTYGNVASSSVGQRQLVGTLSIKYLFVNWFKNITYNWAFKIGDYSNAEAIKKIVYGLSMILRVNPNDASISEDGLLFSFPRLPAYSCESALNLLLGIMIFVATIYLIIKNKQIDKLLREYMLYAIFSYNIFCVFLRWEMSVTRYMISYFAILMPVVAGVLVQLIYTRKKTIGYLVGLLVIGVWTISTARCCSKLVALHPVFNGKSNFTYIHNSQEAYVETCELINSYNPVCVGLLDSEETFEYPIWMLLNDDIVVKHIDVRNETSIYEDKTIIPEFIIAIPDRASDKKIRVNNKCYELANSNSEWNLYKYTSMF